MEEPLNEYEKLVKNLLTDQLSFKNRAMLNTKKCVEEELQREWEMTSEHHADLEMKQNILSSMHRKINLQKNQIKRNNISIYAWVVSLALLITCGTLITILLTQPQKPGLTYVVHSGKQSMKTVILPDGTEVKLCADSKLSYPESFTKKQREVSLSGQAFFKVKEDAQHPFIIKTKDIHVTAVGTSFEVFGFDEDNFVETILLDGKVKVETKSASNKKTQNEYNLNPNEKLVYRKNQPVCIEKVDANNYSAWRLSDQLKFMNEKLSMIIPRLEKWYGQRINCPKDVAEHYRFTFTVHREPLEQILNLISNSAPLVYKLIKNDSYELNEYKLNNIK